MTTNFPRTCVVSTLLFAFVAWPTLAQEPGPVSEGEAIEVPADQPPRLTPEEQERVDQFQAAMAALEDVAFERFVTIADLRAAYDSLNPAALADCALQLAHGESILLRPHRSGLSPRDLLQLASRAAVAQRSPDGVERLIEVAKHLELNDVVEALQSAQKLASEPRASRADLGEHNWIYDRITSAVLHGDSTRIDEIGANMPDDFSDSQRSAVQQAVEQAKRQIADTSASKGLERLGAPSRASISTPHFAITSISPPVLTEGQAFYVNIRLWIGDPLLVGMNFDLRSRPGVISSKTFRNLGGVGFTYYRLGSRVRSISRTTDIELRVEMYKEGPTSPYSTRISRYMQQTQRKPVRVVNVN